jgi:hypothetical protein
LVYGYGYLVEKTSRVLVHEERGKRVEREELPVGGSKHMRYEQEQQNRGNWRTDEHLGPGPIRQIHIH